MPGGGEDTQEVPTCSEEKGGMGGGLWEGGTRRGTVNGIQNEQVINK